MVDKCIHVAKDPSIAPQMRLTPESGSPPFTLCEDCYYIWNNDKRRNPAESEGYNIYRSTNPDLPKDQWLKLNDKPIPRTANDRMQYRDSTTIPGATYYIYIVTVNGIGMDSHPSKVIKLDGGDGVIDLE